MMKNKLLAIFIILFLIKSFVWLLAIPIFQSPDEAVHFGYLQRIAELGSRGDPAKDGIISDELIRAGNYLNFIWGQSHPVWQKPQNNWENKIKNIPQSSRKDFSFDGYPQLNKETNKIELSGTRGRKNLPLFYYLSVPFYKLTANFDFVIRFYASRVFSIILSLLTVLTIYFIGMGIFKKETWAVMLAAAVGFQPMFSFMSVSYNNDNLLILLVTLFVYSGLRMIQKSSDLKFLILSLLVLVLGMFTKPQIAVLALCYPIIYPRYLKKIAFLLILFIVFLPLLSSIIIKSNFMPLRFSLPTGEISDITGFLLKSGKQNIFALLLDYLVSNKIEYLNNLFPWYWGVFGWLEKTMPLLIYRVIKIVSLISVGGILVFFVKNLRKGKNISIMVYLIFAMSIFYLGLFFFDFKVWVQLRRNFGLQGRYLLPVISCQMALLILGIKELLPKKLNKIIIPGLFLAILALNAVGFWSMYSYFHG
jgi:4-amino-4-deoxy-L-arabinose transferase-like glycosyltransferase